MRRFWYRDTPGYSPHHGQPLSAAERADWAVRNHEGYWEYVKEEARLAAEAAVAARIATEKFRRKDNRWFRRLWRHLKR